MKMEFKEPEVKYITEKGKPQSVILSPKYYERLLRALEDQRDIQSAEGRSMNHPLHIRRIARNALSALNPAADDTLKISTSAQKK